MIYHLKSIDFLAYIFILHPYILHKKSYPGNYILCNTIQQSGVYFVQIVGIPNMTAQRFF